MSSGPEPVAATPDVAVAWLHGVTRSVGLLALGFLAFAVVLVLFGKNPLKAYVDIFASTLGSWYGFSETLVKVTPLILTAVAVAVPARIWLINVGGEGQLHAGALFATWGALTWSTWPAWMLLPAMGMLGFLGGGLWASISGLLRARGWVSETISTLLMNYVAILLVNFFVFGPWKDPEGVNYPQTAPFTPAATVPTFGTSRVHLGLVVALLTLALFWFVVARTRWGLEMRAIGGNADAARRNGVPIARYIVALMFVGGGIAGIAGMTEVSAIQGRLRPSLSPGYGYTGFLISWMAAGHPLGILAASFLLAVVTAGGDILQMTQALPGSVVNILMAIILFVVLGRRAEAR
ncbi:MAG TPA: ABC transporter permease [Methylomirabilota bacterium]|jgi:simple sugar transport system permease protein|nr:ABC transporter permease [Methylomirabilota bacterium]